MKLKRKMPVLAVAGISESITQNDSPTQMILYGTTVQNKWFKNADSCGPNGTAIKYIHNERHTGNTNVLTCHANKTHFD